MTVHTTSPIGRRLGAVGVTAALSIFGAGSLLPRCTPAPPAVAAVSTPIPVTDELFSLVNAQRGAAGIAPVGYSEELRWAAEGQSTYQARKQTMTHDGNGGPGARISAQGYTASTWAENVAAGQRNPAEVMDAWMNSAGHRANILSPAVTEMGVAAVAGKDGVIYWTMVFASP